MKLFLGGLSTGDFLQQYWQKKPLLIRQAFAKFEPELDADEIAGLACDELAESRLISGSYPEHDWRLRHGPFTESDFAALPAQNWTLLVQDVEKHYPPLQSLLDLFRFLPTWRIDDLMVSVAAPGGSVGPHADQYDVFLLQASGRRKWQTANRFNSRLLADCELSVLQSFEPEQEWVLEAGDVLYLPPGVAHHGVALDAGMTWSIGMRAPSSADLLQALGEWLASNRNEGERYRDADISTAPLPGQVDTAALDEFRQLLIRTCSVESDFHAFIGSFLAQYRLAHLPATAGPTIGPQQLREALNEGASLEKNPWTRLLWLASDNGAHLFAANDQFNCSCELAEMFCTHPIRLPGETQEQKKAQELACQLLNKGHLYLHYPDD